MGAAGRLMEKEKHACTNDGYGMFTCNDCMLDFDLSGAIEHIVKHQYTVKYDNRPPVMEKSQNTRKYFRELPKEWLRPAR